MSKAICKTILLRAFRVRSSKPAIDLCVLRNPNVGPLRWFSISSKGKSFTVSYLINSHGFSPEAALAASNRVSFETSVKPDSVRSLFRRYGFTDTQMSSVFKARPSLLMSDAEKTILPKFEFFEAKGVEWPQFAKKLSSFPGVLHCSLDKQIVPTYNFFKSVLGSDKKVIMVVARCPDLLARNVEKYTKPNIAILRERGVSDSSIAAVFLSKPSAFMARTSKFLKAVERVIEMGFHPTKSLFVEAVSVVQSLRQATWESKVSTYKKLGFSEEEVFATFLRNPLSMRISSDKITGNMNFLVNQVGLNRSQITKTPYLLGLSLEKRLVPRHCVFRALVSKGLVKEKVKPSALFSQSEAKFLHKFVMPYVESGRAPELLKLYNEKLGQNTVQVSE